MANNVFEQTVGKEVHLSSNQIVSKTIETLIGFTDAEHFERFQKAFAENFRPICSDEYASHVIQKMIEICLLRSPFFTQRLRNDTNEPVRKKKKCDEIFEEEYNASQQFSKSHRKNCSEFLVKVGKFMLNNLEDFVWDPHATYIIRTCIISLAGVYKKKTFFGKRNQTENGEKVATPPEEWKEVVREYISRLEMWPQFSDFAYNTLSSELLSHLAIALNAIDKKLLKHIGKKILTDSFLKVEENDTKKIKDSNLYNENGENNVENDDIQINSTLPMVFKDTSSLRLLETLLIVAGSKLFTQLNAILFTGKIKELSLNKKANFSVQKLIEKIKEKNEFDSVFDEVQSGFEELLKIGHTGVILAIANSCLRLSTKQGLFFSALLNALHVSGTKEKFQTMIICVLKLKPYEETIEDKSNFIHLHGSLILQHMLEFSKPIKLVQCMLEMPAENLAMIFSSTNGSFVANAFAKSKSIGEKSREKLLKHLQGTYVSMAITQFGSRVLEVLFEIANDVQRSKIGKELSERLNQLNSTLFGRLLAKKLRIDILQSNSALWKASFSKAKKAEKLFEDIIK